MKGAFSGNGGFTLVELVLTILLLGIIAAIVSQFILQGVRSYSVEQNRSDVHAQVRLAVERVAREARSIRSCGDILGPANPSATLQFTDLYGVTVTFSVAGGNLLRGADVLARGVSSATPFRFLDRTGAVLPGPAFCTAPNDIWFVEIDLTCVQGGESLNLRTQVHPRNF